jgi:hypothetical protein
VLVSCVPGFFDANGSPVDGCEYQQDQFEPNDTQGTAEFMGQFGEGSGRTVDREPHSGQCGLVQLHEHLRFPHGVHDSHRRERGLRQRRDQPGRRRDVLERQ